VGPAVAGHVLVGVFLALLFAGPTLRDLLLAAGLRRIGFSPENIVAFVAARGRGRGS